MESVAHLFDSHPERDFLVQLLSDTLDGAALEARISFISHAILGTTPKSPKTAVSLFL